MPLMKETVKATLKGIISSQEQYESWSGGCWLWEAPEYLITTCIAKRLSTLDVPNLYITLENNVRQAMEHAGGLTRGRPPHTLRLDGKFDILLWEGDTPRVVIEVKNRINSYAELLNDVDRICAVLRKQQGESIRNGLVAFYTSKYKEGDEEGVVDFVKNRLDRIEGNVRKYVEEMDMTLKSFKRSTVRRENDSAWAAAVLHICLRT